MDEKKSRYNDAQLKASTKYKREHIKRIALEVQIEEYNRIKDHCDQNNIKVNTWLKELIRKELNNKE